MEIDRVEPADRSGALGGCGSIEADGCRSTDVDQRIAINGLRSTDGDRWITIGGWRSNNSR